MTMVQIEKDSPEVIERARQEIASLARNIAIGTDRHSQAMLFLGYCRALSHEGLIGLKVLDQLSDEMEQAFAAVTSPKAG
ncbi:hypothetical protein ACIPL1_27840 [Pseudomonas sp. NPDC090202]|uniref:hypothetical protein n=1 Tax=Pseudomonas sp. NPDC090202 TaxID=3364476 RepID=UPI0037FB4C5B